MLSYEPLKKTLKKKKLKMRDLRKHVSSRTLYKMAASSHAAVSLTTICKICQVLDCEIGDIVAYVPENKNETSKGVIK